MRKATAIIVLVIVTMLTVLLVGCGGTESTSSTTSSIKPSERVLGHWRDVETGTTDMYFSKEKQTIVRNGSVEVLEYKVVRNEESSGILTIIQKYPKDEVYGANITAGVVFQGDKSFLYGSRSIENPLLYSELALWDGFTPKPEFVYVDEQQALVYGGDHAISQGSGDGSFVTVPSVVGMNFGDANSAIEGVGLVLSVDHISLDISKNKVLGQDPPAGTRVTKGATIMIDYDGMLE